MHNTGREPSRCSQCSPCKAKNRAAQTSSPSIKKRIRRSDARLAATCRANGVVGPAGVFATRRGHEQLAARHGCAATREAATARWKRGIIPEALARREAGETLMDIARSYGVSHPTISRL